MERKREKMQGNMAKAQARASDFRWDDLRVFLALWRERTLAGAGAKLGVDATTVGRRLTALEEAIGTTLFDRTRDGVLPTSAAEQLVALAEDTERCASALFDAASTFESAPEGVVRLTTPPTVAEALILPLLPELQARFPKIRLEIDATTSFADLTRREADIALRVRKPESGDLLVVKLFDTPYAAFASPALRERLGTLERLEDAPWIGWTEAFAGIPAARWAREHVPTEAAFVLRVGSMATQLAGAQRGVGVTLLPVAIGRLFGLEPIHAAKGARAALEQVPTEQLWLVGHRALRNVPRVAAVWDLLVERAAKLVATVVPG